PYNLLKDVLEEATQQSINVFTASVLKSKTGMNSGVWIANGNNTFYVSTARDMARFGLLIQNQGQWKDEQIIESGEYFESMINTSQSLNPSYGYLWWLNGKASHVRPNSLQSVAGPIAPDAPSDLITAAGAMGQLISFSPESGLMMVRQGESEATDLAALTMINTIWKKIGALEAGNCGVTTDVIRLQKTNCVVFPNPVRKMFYLDCVSKTQFDFLEIVDTEGRMVYQTTSDQGPINVSTWRKGLYIINIRTKDLIYSQKLIID
ncbi:MAG: T9SS type A sorting domain-containing protein, partial [Cyclobacteriaceae bacterium]